MAVVRQHTKVVLAGKHFPLTAVIRKIASMSKTKNGQTIQQRVMKMLSHFGTSAPAATRATQIHRGKRDIQIPEMSASEEGMLSSIIMTDAPPKSDNKFQGGLMSPVGVDPALRIIAKGGETFAVKDQLRDLGCRFHTWTFLTEDHKAWFAPNQVVQAQAQALCGQTPNTPPTDDPATQLRETIEEMKKQLKTANDSVAKRDDEINELKLSLSKQGSKHLKITIGTLETTLAVITDKVLPHQYRKVLDLASARRNILLVGPAGCGKTYLGGLIAESLDLDFGSLSCTSGMSETHLLGRSTPNFHTGKNEFQSTEFLRLYEEGGVFLLDEVDAADPNLLLALNSALANGYCNVPNRIEQPRAEKHEDFICIATANTFGRGATRSYAGRNALDEATLDRFRIGTVECYYDKAVEFVLCPNDDLRHRLQTIRTKVLSAGIRRVVSTRFLQDAFIMMTSCKWSVETIVETLTEGWTDDEKAKALSV